jgi:precorrin-6B methylase 2
MKKYHRQSNLAFHLMSMEFHLRDWLRPPIKILQEASVHSGMTVLDFGCGPGGFSLAAARLVGPEGRVYAMDIHPLAVKSVQRAADKQGFNNIQTVFGGSLVLLC